MVFMRIYTLWMRVCVHLIHFLLCNWIEIRVYLLNAEHDSTVLLRPRPTIFYSSSFFVVSGFWSKMNLNVVLAVQMTLPMP